METNEFYACEADGIVEFPEEIRQSGIFRFPDAHLNPESMAALALALREHRHDPFACVPFCLTTEAEALGGRIDLGNDRSGPRVAEYAYKTVSDLLEIDCDHALTAGNRVRTVMEAIGRLSVKCPIILNVNGIFTTLVSLVDIQTLYKTLRSDEGTVMAVFEKLKLFLVRFAALGVESGAKVISYADPVGDITIMGMKSFCKYAAPVTREVVGDILKLLDGERMLHLCGRMTNGLHRTGLLRVGRIEMLADSYGGGILKMMAAGNHHFIGNHCIKKTNMKYADGKAPLFPLAFTEE